MYVVSYCFVVTFHPVVNLTRLVIYRSYDQTINQLNSLVHFDIVKQDFFEDEQIFNSKTLLQLKYAVLSVINRDKNTALTEMFSTELKFAADCLKFWFNKYRKVLEISPKENKKFMIMLLKTIAVFSIFRFNLEQKMDGFNTFARSNIYS